VKRRYQSTPPFLASHTDRPTSGVNTASPSWAAARASDGSPAAPVKPADAIEPLLTQGDLARLLNASRRTVERLRASGKLPRPDLHIGKMPRWRPRTIREWIDGGDK
jgi:hypothetical protein